MVWSTNLPIRLQLNKANSSDNDARFWIYIWRQWVGGPRLNDGSGIKRSVKSAGVCWSVIGRAHRGLTVGRLLLQRFRVGLLLSARLVSSQWWILIKMIPVLIHWWEEVLHADRTMSICIWTTKEPRVSWLERKPGLGNRTRPSPPPDPRNLWLTVPRRYFCYGLYLLSMFVRVLFVFDLLFSLFRIALWLSVGKELSPWLFTDAVFISVPS